jgi:hypothetical protein
VTDAELRALLMDCLALWGVSGKVGVGNGAVEITTAAGCFVLRRADSNDRPVRWFLHTPKRGAAGRGPRPVPSITALLSMLRRLSTDLL